MIEPACHTMSEDDVFFLAYHVAIVVYRDGIEFLRMGVQIDDSVPDGLYGRDDAGDGWFDLNRLYEHWHNMISGFSKNSRYSIRIDTISHSPFRIINGDEFFRLCKTIQTHVDQHNAGEV